MMKKLGYRIMFALLFFNANIFASVIVDILFGKEPKHC